MKTLLKLAVVALVANATWRVGTAYMSFYRFKDSVQATTQFRGEKSDQQIRARILELAGEFDVPISEQTLSLRIDEAHHTIVDATYERPIDVLPGFTYPWPFAVHVDTFTMTPQKPDR
jgi:hypothetical protein